MFAMAIIGIVLAAAYATASKNLQTNQLTKERTQAVNIAEAQLEQLKILKEVPSLGTFCIDIEADVADDVIIDATDPNCIESYYNKTITKTDNNYKIVVEWTPPGGTDANKANVTLYYTDYNPN
jgi:type II secretory pathway pseudopilin PulG